MMFRYPILSFVFGVLSCVGLPDAHGATEITNIAHLREQLGLQLYTPPPSSLSALKIAILDNGFSGFDSGKGQLPESAIFVAGPGNAQAPSNHGLGMAEIVWAMTGKHPEGPHFYLVNTNGFTNFKAAVDFVLQEHIDIVLYAQVWPFGSNFDGTGFINEAVNKATQAGVVWINAAGNFGEMVHEAKIAPNTDIEFKNTLDENEITITLSWTDFRASENYSTNKDLDLYVYDSQNKVVAKSELIQRGEAPPASGTSSLSSYARESLTLQSLERGTYRISVQDKSGNFEANDRFRVLLEPRQPGSATLTNPTSSAEIFAPADNPNVLTVGEDFTISSRGMTADGRIKPDVVIDASVVSFSNGTTVRGSSTASALLAGTLALMKAQKPSLNSAVLLRYSRSLQIPTDNTDGLTPAGPKAWPPLPEWVTDLVPDRGRLMIHPNGHFVVLCPMDPLTLPAFQAGHAFRQNPDDILLLNPEAEKWAAIPRSQTEGIQSPWIEFRKSSSGSALWVTPSPTELGNW
ncbi:S8 family serine peptidase [Bdellovibrionota bacterium FG-1]